MRRGVEYCGKHPFATGLFALTGIVGLLITVIGFQKDRVDAQKTADQIEEVEIQLEEISGRIGTSFRGGIFLYEQPIEGVYTNDWWAHPLKSMEEIRETGSAELTITGEGKTVEFIGTLSMDCSGRHQRWRGVQNFYDSIRGDDERITELVPNQVIRNVYRLFCRE
jgi:hypothetical protein